MGKAESRADGWFRELIVARSGDGPTRLPALAEMAEQCGVAPRTMARVVHRFEDRGLCMVVRRGGVFVTANAAERLPRPNHTTSCGVATLHQHLTTRIAADIARGVFATGGVLPGYKELQCRYAANYRTLRKALAVLAEAGTLEAQGSRFAVPAPPRPAGSLSLQVVVPDMRFTVSLGSSDLQRLWSTLETECTQRSIAIHTYGLFDGGRMSETNVVRKLRKRTLRLAQRGLCGSIFVMPRLGSGIAPSALQTLRVPGSRVVAIDIGGTPSPEPMPRRGPGQDSLRIVAHAGNDEAGRRLAGHLFALGHRHIACFAGDDSTASLRRLSSVKQTFDRYGGTCSASVFLAEQNAHESTMAPATRAVYTQTRDVLHHMRHDIESEYVPGKLSLGKRLQAEVDVAAMLNLRVFTPAFLRALRDERITAWVGFNDAVALCALEFLRLSEVPDPLRISVAGFDNTPQSMLAGLTSYDFNIARTVRASLDYLIAPRRPGAVPVVLGGEHEPGFVVPRRSTRAV